MNYHPDELAELLAGNADLGIEKGTLDGAADALQKPPMPNHESEWLTEEKNGKTRIVVVQYRETSDRGGMKESNRRKPRASRNKATGEGVAHESEKDFQSWCIDLLKLKGYRVAHFRPGMTSRKDQHGKPVWVTPMIGDPGFVDLVAAKRDERHSCSWVLFIELKSDDGHLSPAQQGWQDALSGYMGGTVSYQVWRPADRDTIMRKLE